MIETLEYHTKISIHIHDLRNISLKKIVQLIISLASNVMSENDGSKGEKVMRRFNYVRNCRVDNANHANLQVCY